MTRRPGRPQVTTNGPKTRIFFRDDDVSELNPALLSFTRAFAGRSLPVSYQIIPEGLTEECAGYMRDLRDASPELVEFGQHGLRHQMMVRGKLEYYEFGPERTYEQQLADIREGSEILRRRMGDDYALRVFTPPRHRYDRNTLRALKASGFEVLSASSYTTTAHRLAYGAGRALGLSNLGRPGVSYHGAVRPDCGLYELSIAVGVDSGSVVLGPVESVVQQVTQARGHVRDLGLMFHHNAYGGEEGASYLNALLDRLTDLPDVSFHRILDLYAQAA